MSKPTHAVMLGDVHGDFAQILKISRRHMDFPVYALGDLGLGFPYQKKVKGLWIPDYTRKDPEKFSDNIFFLRGNHDRPDVCRAHPNYLGDYGTHALTGVFFLSGAKSTELDASQRTEGVDWWHNEELSYDELQKAIDAYVAAKPSVVISHEAPASLHEFLVSHHTSERPSRTSRALQVMLEEHRPDLHVFGHHHRMFQKKINGTLFVCQAINQATKFPL